MKAIASQYIKITDPYVKRAQDNLVDYLLSLDAKRFLFEIYKVAGLEPITESGYDGWERSNAINFRGHFFGHFLSATALAYQTETDTVKKEQLLLSAREAVEGLAKAQKNYGKLYPESAGYLSAFRESALDEVEGKEIVPEDKENVLVPWYNLHKILAGLIDLHVSFKEVDVELSRQALLIASNFGDYVFYRMMKLADKNQMLQIEYGGMNDALYNLFALTQKKEHRLAATYFDEDELFAKLADKQDVLSGKHANTMIPKFIGALKRYSVLSNHLELLSDEERDSLETYFTAAKNFWDINVNAHTYCTGGNSQSEHFHDPNALYFDAEMRNGDCTCETCNTHNMLKLTRNLYFLTQEKKYLDYYEQTYINAILASQNPTTGMMMYFQPMGAGYNKVYNRPYDEFWCCTGTGVESFAKLADTFYLEENETIYVNSYFSNELKLAESNIVLKQETDRKRFQTKLTLHELRTGISTDSIQLALRIPSWSTNTTIKINGAAILIVEDGGFVHINRMIGVGDVIEIEFQATPRLVSTPDNTNYVAFVYGPYVLAGGLGKEGVEEDNPNGILVRVGTKNHLLSDTLTFTEPNWRGNFLQFMKEIDLPEKLVAFQLTEIEEEIIFSPYYEMHEERYGIYFKLMEKDSEEARKVIEGKKELIRKLELIYQDLHNFDENNSEYAKKLRYEHSTIGDFFGKRYRRAEANGWFAYEFNFTPITENICLELQFHTDDQSKELNVTIEDETYKLKVEESSEFKFVKHQIILDSSKVKNDSISIKFAGNNGASPRVFGICFSKI